MTERNLLSEAIVRMRDQRDQAWTDRYRLKAEVARLRWWINTEGRKAAGDSAVAVVLVREDLELMADALTTPSDRKAS